MSIFGNATKKLTNRKTGDQIVKSLKEFLKNSLVQVYGSSDKSDYAQVLAFINQDSQSAVCAKQLTAGDVAWRCLDCEKDPTCIICKDCFEKSDHEGHRVQLKRNISGCCDCGDPEAWDENHFCSDHKGYNVDPEELLEKLPAQIRSSAEQVFENIAVELKRYCMRLQNYGDQCQVDGMPDDTYKKTMIDCIQLLTKFMFDRIEECPSFIHILGKSLNRIYLKPDIFVKNDDHKKCCVRVFPPNSAEEMAEFEEVFKKHPEFEGLCSCTPLDLCMQTNYLLDNNVRETCYQLLFKLFQSYRFKQYLTLSLTANYSYIICKTEDSENDISSIGVQVFTSDEMSILVFKNADLRNNILTQLWSTIKDFKASPNNDATYYQMFKVMHDIKYIARPECLKYCIENTDFLERFISILSHFYFIDAKEMRTTMVNYMNEGGVNDRLLNLESFLIKIAIQYFKEVPLTNHEKTRSLLLAFKKCFEEINTTINAQKLNAKGFYNLPAHRLFSYYLTRLLVFGWIEKGKKGTRPQGISVTEGFRSILRESLMSSDQQKKEPKVEESKASEQITEDDKEKPQLISSLAEDESSSLVQPLENDANDVEKQIDSLLQYAMLPIIQGTSFVHEIEAKKWVYHGIYLEHFPTLYYRVLSDEYFLQDVGLCQMLLCCEDEERRSNPYDEYVPVIDKVIDNAGLDKQLQTLMNGIIQRKLNLNDLTQLQGKFDPDKLRMHLTIFLRYMIYVCLCEISFLKQVFNRKDIKAEKMHHIKNENSEEAKAIWKDALKKEAVHLLMLNKVNTPIADLKQSMISTLVKDEVFQDILFEVSDQGRDINNQVTFRLKPEYYPWFDPFQYGLPEQHSQIYQMYDTNKYKDKCFEEGLNDIVGDYLGNYKQATSVNQQIMDSMATSKLPKIICPILAIWLKQRKKGPQDGSDAMRVEKKEEGGPLQMGMASLIQRLQAQSQTTTSGGTNTSLINQIFQSQLQKLDSSDKDKFTADEKNNDVVFNEDFLAKLIDNTLGHYCLKLLTIFVNAFTRQIEDIDSVSSQVVSCKSKLSQNDKIKFTLELCKQECELLKLLLDYRSDLTADEDKKTHKLITYLLAGIYKLDTSNFSFVGIALGLVAADPQEEDGANRNQEPLDADQSELASKKESSVVDPKKKKEKVNKMKSRLMKKMKSNASKFLESREDNEPVTPAESKTSEVIEEEIHCAFCTEALSKETFKQNPYGNFAFIQSTKLLHHSMEQTIKGQRQALRNADLSQQFQNQNSGMTSSLVDDDAGKTDCSDFYQELKFDETATTKEQSSLSGQIDSSSKSYKLQKQNVAKIVCNLKGPSFLNQYTGAGAVVTTCKHYSHLSCLRKYYLEQTTEEGQHHQQLTGFSPDEFACPICKTIQNSLLPMYSLQDFEGEMDVQTKKEKFISSQEKDIPLMEFYVDYMSQIIKKQQGFLSKKEHEDQEYKKLMQTILLIDVRQDPRRVVKHLCNYFVHRISLIDIKGLGDFKQNEIADQLSNLHSSLGSLLRLSLGAQQVVIDEDVLHKELNAMQNDVVESMFTGKEKSIALFANNLLAYCLELLFVCSIKYQNPSQYTQEQYDSAIDYIVRQFYYAFRLQFICAALFRKNNGTLKGTRFEIMKQLSNIELVLFNKSLAESSDLDDTLTQIQLPLMRKLFAAVYSLKKRGGEQAVQGGETAGDLPDKNILKEVCGQADDQKELEAIMNYLKLSDQMKSLQESMFPDGQIEEVTVEAHLEPVAVSLHKLSGHKFLDDMLTQFAQQLTENADKIVLPNQETDEACLRVDMPVNLILLTPYFEFNLFEMPANFKNLQTQYYKKKCDFCNRVVIENATCLLNGKTMCWFKMRRAQNMEQCRVNQAGQQEPTEGLLSWHSRVEEGGVTILMQTSSGRIVLINNGVSAICSTPYRNRFGEQASDDNKSYDDFAINEQGGGIEALKKLKKSYMNFTIANDVLQQRTNPDAKFRVYLKNVL